VLLVTIFVIKNKIFKHSFQNLFMWTLTFASRTYRNRFETKTSPPLICQNCVQLAFLIGQILLS